VATTPTQRTLKKLKDNGMTAGVVEKWNPHAKIRQDLFGVGDVLAYDLASTLMIQATSGSNVSKRLRKILDDDKLRERVATWVWVDGRRFEVWGWRKAGARGKRKLWGLRRTALETNDGITLKQRELADGE
jgi:hypothetical protein